MSKSLHKIAKDYIREVTDAVAKVSDLSDAREETDTKALYLAMEVEQEVLLQIVPKRQEKRFSHNLL